MASTFSQNLAIELIGTGDQAGTWGVTTNTNLGTLIEQAISGYVTQAVSTGADTTITIPNGATGVARNMYIELTGTGGTNTNLIVPSNKKLYIIFNNTASGQVTVKVSGQTGVSVPNGKKMILVSNGTDIVNGLNYIADFGTNSFTVTNLTASSGTITNLIATTGTITTLSATSGSITNLVSSDASATVLRSASATLTHLSATSASITNLALTSLTISSLSITNVSVASATVSSNLTLSGGTANGVLYLNGSKVATSGSALTFDGTNLGVGTATPSKKVDVRANVVGESALMLISNDNASGTSGSPTVASIEFASAGVAKASIAGAVYGNDWLSFRTGSNTERMRLTSTSLYTASGIDVGIGTATPGSYLSGTAKLVAYANANSQNNILVRNDSNGASSSAAVVLNASGNTWGIEIGSATKNNNALTFQLDYGITNSTKMTLDSSGNLGLGVTPSTTIWSGDETRLVVKGTGTNFAGTIAVESKGTSNAVTGFLVANDIVNSLVFGAKTNTPLAFYTNNTERARITSTGLGITEGNNPTQALSLYRAGSTNAIMSAGNSNTGLDGTWFGVDTAGNGIVNVRGAFPLLFSTSANERARITSGGRFLVGTTTSTYPIFFSLASDQGDWFARFHNTQSTSPYGLVMEYTAASPNGTANEFFYCQDNASGGTLRASIRSNGGLANYQSNNVDLSDARTKKDIAPAASMWGKIGALEIVTYKYNDQTHDDVNLGVIAQQVESVEPVWVDNDGWGNETPEGEEPLKTVYTKDITFAAIKALQEAMARIEQLEADVAAMKGAA